MSNAADAGERADREDLTPADTKALTRLVTMERRKREKWTLPAPAGPARALPLPPRSVPSAQWPPVLAVLLPLIRAQGASLRRDSMY